MIFIELTIVHRYYLNFDTREYIKYHKVWKKVNNPEIKKILYTEDGELKSKIEIKLDNTKNNILILK